MKVESVMDSQADTIRDLQKSNEELLEALDRQCDNMSFVLSHVPVPDKWYKKFSEELQKDRAAIKKAKGAP